jgi:hypothetical protein
MVHNTTAINPSFLNKGNYSTIEVRVGPGAVKEKIKAEIARLD